MLFLSTFGPLHITWSGKPIPLGNGKPAALLIFLVLAPGLHSREKLVDLLWPGLSEESARRSLRQAVFLLRSVLTEASGQAGIVSRRYQVGFDANMPFQADAAQLVSSLPDCAELPAAQRDACLARLADLAQLYKGPFLVNFTMSDCPSFEDWCQIKREQLHRRALDLLARLADGHEQQGDHRSALPFALRYTELEPCSEDGYSCTMRLYAMNGQRDAALGQYEVCCRLLEHELGVQPSAQLQALAECVRRDEFGAPLAAVGLESRVDEGRHPVTVLYCELETIGIDDPEDAMECLRHPLTQCEEISQRFFGHINHLQGGGLLVYFGYPQALESTALFAVRAARLMASKAAPGLAVRLGIHSGLIVVTSHSRIPDPIGLTSNRAIQLGKCAASGEVLVSAETQHRLAGYFHLASIGELVCQGVSPSLQAFRVVNETGATHRLAAAAHLTPFAGRKVELARLADTWMKAGQGQFKALLVSGTAGIGKSRLVSALVVHLETDSGLLRELRCFPETRQSPFLPVIALYESLCSFMPEDGVEVRLAKLLHLLQTRAPQLVQRGLPLMSRMLGLPPSSLYPLPDLAPDQLKSATYALLIDLLHAVASRNPVLLVAEDMHWADASTLEVLSLLVRAGSMPVMLLMTARPEWRPDWPGLAVMTLAPLPDADVLAMVRSVRADMAPERLGHILARADGIPLFAEELAAMSQEGELPGSLHDLLAIRLDKLGPARAVAQLAATLGNEFELDILGRICELSADELSVTIGRLKDSGLVQALADQRFQFKHALVREAAYGSLTKNARQTAHRRIAHILQSGYRSIAEQHPEILAQHLGAAGEASAAMGWWVTAGHRAASHYAHSEAVSHYDAGLGLLDEVPADMTRNRLECALLTGLARSEQEVVGYGRGRSGAALDRAVALLEQGAGEATDIFNAVWGLWEGAGSRVGHAQAVRLARRLLDIATQEKTPALLQQAHYALGNSLFWTGTLAQAHEHLEISVALENPDNTTPVCDSYGRIMRVAAQAYLSWVLWMQGRTDLAQAASEAALQLARHHQNLNAQAFALTFAATLQRWQGRLDDCWRLAEEGRAVSVSCFNAVFEAVNQMTLGWVSVMRGDVGAIGCIEQGVNAIRQAMSGVAVSMLAPFAEALLHLGEYDKAYAIVQEALEQSELKQDQHYLAELHRLAGRCLSMKGNTRAALSCFEQAAQVGHAQGARGFELRAKHNKLSTYRSGGKSFKKAR